MWTGGGKCNVYANYFTIWRNILFSQSPPSPPSPLRVPATAREGGEGRGRGTLLALQSPTNSIQSIFLKNGPRLPTANPGLFRGTPRKCRSLFWGLEMVPIRGPKGCPLCLWVSIAVSPWLGRWQGWAPCSPLSPPLLPPCSILPESGGHDSRYRIGEGGEGGERREGWEGGRESYFPGNYISD